MPLAAPVDCPAQGRLTFRAQVGKFLRDEKECATVNNPFKEVLTSWSHLATLGRAYATAVARGDNGSAAMVAADISARLTSLSQQELADQIAMAEGEQNTEIVSILQRQANAQTSNVLNVRLQGWNATALTYAGHKLGVAQPSIASPSKIYMSNSMRDAVIEFQQQNGLSKKVGMLNYETLRSMSGKDIATITAEFK